MPEGIPIYGKALVELRQLRCMTQDDLSNACEAAGWPVPREMISLYERDKTSPTPQTLAAIAKVLELSRVDMRALVHTPTLDTASSNGDTGQEDNADRRTAGKVVAVGGLSVVWARAEALERIMAHGDRPVDGAVISAHEELADMLGSVHRTTPRDVLAGPVAYQADLLLALLDRPARTLEDRQRLEAVAAGSCAHAGVEAFCLGDRLAQRRYFALARAIAQDSGNDTLRAQVLSVERIQHSPLEGGIHGGSGRAVTLMRQAVAHARRADPATHADARHWLGLELAADGDERGFLEHCEMAARLLGRAQTEGRGFFARYLWMAPEEANRTRGFGLVRVGRASEALDALQVELDPARAVSLVIAGTDIAAARVLLGEPERACQELTRALDLTFDAGYVSGLQRIRGVRAQFHTTPTDWAKLSCVIELDEQLNLAIASFQRKR